MSAASIGQIPVRISQSKSSSEFTVRSRHDTLQSRDIFRCEPSGAAQQGSLRIATRIDPLEIGNACEYQVLMGFPVTIGNPSPPPAVPASVLWVDHFPSKAWKSHDANGFFLYICDLSANCPPPHASPDSMLLDEIERALSADAASATSRDEVPPDRNAIRACLALASRLESHIQMARQFRIAAFTDEDGGVTLAIQPAGARRRVTYSFSPDGALRAIEKIDADRGIVSISPRELGRAADGELLAWLTSER